MPRPKNCVGDPLTVAKRYISVCLTYSITQLLTGYSSPYIPIQSQNKIYHTSFDFCLLRRYIKYDLSDLIFDRN